MKCKYCKIRLVGVEEVDGICFDCQESVEDAENLNELNRYREMFPVPPWSTEPITHEICEAIGMVRSKCESRSGDPVSWWRDPTGELSVRVAEDETCIAGFGYNKAAGQLACLVVARRNNEKH